MTRMHVGSSGPLALAVLLCGRAALACVADCDVDGVVSAADRRAAIELALAGGESAACARADNDRDGGVTAEEIVLGVSKGIAGCGVPSAFALYSAQNNQLDVYDLATGAVETLVPSSRDTVNGQVCLVPGSDGEFVAGTDTEQPRLRPGWGIYSADGVLQQKLPLPAREGETLVGDPIGCAFDAAGRLFGTAIGSQGAPDGQLVVYFPPLYQESCILDDRIRVPGTLAIDDDGNLYVPETAPPGKIHRYAPPFPADSSECGSVAPAKSAFIEYADPVASLGVARGPNGHWFVSLVVGFGSAGPTIREHDADGVYLRDLLPKGRGGNPAGLAVDEDGTVYYADLGLSPAFATVRGKATVRRIAFDENGEPRFPEILGVGLSFADGVGLLPRRRQESRTLGGSLRRSYFNGREQRIGRDTVAELVPKWRYMTGAIVTASPAVAFVDLPGEGPTRLVIVPSWDGRVYALRAENGRRLWSFAMKPQPGSSFPFSSSATVAEVGGRDRVFVGGGMTMYALDAASGALLWEFDAGTGCTDCGFDEQNPARRERNEVLSTAAVYEGLVYFGMDVDDGGRAKGGLYAVDAESGVLVWYFDVTTAATCRASAGDDVRRFDGYHDAAELGLPEDFFATRPGCDFDRTGNACGSVWSSVAVDDRRRLLYIASSNCDTDEDPSTPEPLPPMPPYDEAVFALTPEGEPVWVWRPREIDNDDLAFGAVPNLFAVEIEGVVREVVGVGNKDGVYYLLDRDGVNEITGLVEPYWATPTVPGGPIGGIIASAAVGDGGVFFGTALGEGIGNPQKPSTWALRATDGAIQWSDSEKNPGFGATTGVPGVVFTGEIASGFLWAYDSASGVNLKKLDTLGRPGGVASAAVVVDGVLYVGGGVGARGGRPAEEGFIASETDTPISAFCIRGEPDCPGGPLCSDGNQCTHDFRQGGACASDPAPDGLRCVVGARVGVCVAGACVF